MGDALSASVLGRSERTRVEYGNGIIGRLGEFATGLGAKHALVVTDPGIVAVGHVDRAEASLRAAGLDVSRFADVHENPSESDVSACRAAAADLDIDVLIGLGGGSSIDVAKGCAFLRAGGGRMADYRGHGLAKGELLPLIAVPTTAGTGSEMQSYALITHDETHEKLACGDPQAAARIAVLDPELTLTQPRRITAVTGLDTLAHAVESAVTKKRNATSDACADEAFELVAANFPHVLEAPNDLEARGAMLRASACAGLAIEHSMLGAAHSMANPLTAHFDVTHGCAVGCALPTVVRYNAERGEVATRYVALRPIDELVTVLRHCVRAAGVASELGHVDRAAIPTLAREAAEQWTAQFNPRQVGPDDFASLYGAMLDECEELAS